MKSHGDRRSLAAIALWVFLSSIFSSFFSVAWPTILPELPDGGWYIFLNRVVPGLVSRIERREEKKKRDRQEESGCCKQGGGASAGSTWNAQSRPRLAKGENETIGIDSWLEGWDTIQFARSRLVSINFDAKVKREEKTSLEIVGRCGLCGDTAHGWEKKQKGKSTVCWNEFQRR